jgi:hypothetical protein
MPEPPEVSEELEFEVASQPANVPLREGEESFGAALTLEDLRRKESIIKDLRNQLKLLDGTSVNEMRTKYASSPSARRRQISCRKKVEELQKLTFKRGNRWEGPCSPFTVVNLNPIGLQLIVNGDCNRWTIPEAGRGERINLRFRGRQFVGSYMTIKTPHVYPAHTGTHNDKQSGVDMPAVEYRYIPPSGLAHLFVEHYNFLSADSTNLPVGGVIAFEGDIHMLDPKRLERSEGCIWVPKKEITLDGFGDVVYTVEQMKLVDCVESAVVKQQNYANTKINEGHGFSVSQSELIRNQLSMDHRIWHNYALHMGYIEKALPWAVERMHITPTTPQVVCPDCGTRQTSPEQYFCANCNSPFDALKAFLAGKTVSPDRLAMYEGEEWDAVVAEAQRRKAKIAVLELPGELSDESRKPKNPKD